MSVTVQQGSEVCVSFSLSLEDGTVVDATDPGDSWCFTLGDGVLVEGLEKVLIGLAEGEQRHAVLAPEETFGARDEEAIQQLPLSDFPADMKLETGVVVGFDLPSGEEIPGIIMALEGDHVWVDLNHPLAGHTIVFDVQVVSITSATA